MTNEFNLLIIKQYFNYLKQHDYTNDLNNINILPSNIKNFRHLITIYINKLL